MCLSLTIPCHVSMRSFTGYAIARRRGGDLQYSYVLCGLYRHLAGTGVSACPPYRKFPPYSELFSKLKH